MMVTVFSYFAWIHFSPIAFLVGHPWGTFPTIPLLIVNTIVYVPLIYYTIRLWLRTMMRRKSGPAAGIDTVEPGDGIPEPGDEWGLATRPYSFKPPTKVIGFKSEIRESPIGIDTGFFVKIPDLAIGEAIFDATELRSKVMKRSTVSSGGWVSKRVSSRSAGSLKASETSQHGRSLRFRIPPKKASSIHLPSTVVAAVARTGRIAAGQKLVISKSDIREKVFTARIPLTVILVIDVSMSMKGSMSQVRDLLERIERETRGSRDRAGIIAFKDSGAVEVQTPTSNWNKLYRGFTRLRISGLTPLAEGLMKSLETIKRERMRRENIEPLVIIISDFAPNVPLAQSVGPGQARYTPVRDLIKASRMLRKANVRLAAVNVDPKQIQWVRILKRPYHDALELATMLRMRKEGHDDPMETLLAVPEFRKTFGAYLIARAGGGHAYLSRELMRTSSVFGELLKGTHEKVRLRASDLLEAEAYLSH
jgi:Mg-chelatase subunit ChlD